MAIIASHLARAVRRNLKPNKVVRHILPRQTPTTVDGQPIVNPLPVSVKVLTALFVVLGILVLGIITWRIVVWRRRKALTASQQYRQSNFTPSEKIGPIADGRPMEKQEVLVILPMQPPMSVPASSVKWKPQIPRGYETSAAVDTKMSPPDTARSPPPTYTTASGSPSGSPRPPALKLPIVTVSDEGNALPVHNNFPSPVPSPRRTSSFMKEAPTEGNMKPKPSLKGQKFPRKMLVEHTFIPSLADELSIKVGEVLTMLEEYEDEWCLVERLGGRSGERGVVPRFCLKERPRAHKRNKSTSSAKSGTSTRVQ